MTFNTLRLAFSAAHPHAVYTFIIILVLTITIAGALCLDDWLITTILSGKELKILKSYHGFSN